MVWKVRDRGIARGHRRKEDIRFRPGIESLETRCLLDCTGNALFERTYDGTCNNLDHPEWGSNNVALLRTAPAAYADGISAPVVGNPPRPSPRVISNLIVDQRYTLAAGQSITQSWSQDATITATTNGNPSPPTSTTITATVTTTFVGNERITVPAGTFDTCKFIDSVSTNGSSSAPVTHWVLLDYGVDIQSISNGDTVSAQSISKAIDRSADVVATQSAAQPTRNPY